MPDSDSKSIDEMFDDLEGELDEFGVLDSENDDEEEDDEEEDDEEEDDEEEDEEKADGEEENAYEDEEEGGLWNSVRDGISDGIKGAADSFLSVGEETENEEGDVIPIHGEDD